MRPEDLQRADDLFHAALERPIDERVSFLAAACGEADLRAEVVALLDAHEAATGYFETLADRIASTTDLEVAAREQLRVGPYQILRVIGRGGMGTVFLAERVDGQFDQKVALKIIRLGMESDDGVRRFLAERQIVARLDHPHIARLLDGGATDEGRPYFVMEYVDGLALTDYCDPGRLSIERRIELVVAVGEAVHYAHRNLIVHRDLKPSNILVTADGTVKLVDFGIAKLLHDDADPGQRSETRTGERVLSAPYAAPEQLVGGPITTATDTYGLGVVLYELLTGRRPHDSEHATSRDLERAVLEREPERPSALIDQLARRTGEGGAGEAERVRSTRPDRPDPIDPTRSAAAAATRRSGHDLSQLVPANSRVTVPSSEFGLSSGERFGVRVNSDQPIVVERAMYWNALGQFWSAGTNETAVKIR